MTTETSKATDEAEIRGLIAAWAAAIRAKDADGVLAPPLQADVPLKKSLEEWFQTFRGPIGYEIHDLKITVGGDVTFCHSLNRISGQRTNSEDTDIWVRETIGLRKIDGRWLITHEHESVPFYMDGSYRAAVDLKP
jgi:ketosteroid isomerase-like protein